MEIRMEKNLERMFGLADERNELKKQSSAK